MNLKNKSKTPGLSKKQLIIAYAIALPLSGLFLYFARILGTCTRSYCPSGKSIIGGLIEYVLFLVIVGTIVAPIIIFTLNIFAKNKKSIKK